MTILLSQEKPALLMLTGSFPSGPADETCGYIRDFARALAAEFDVTVLAPPDENACRWPDAGFNLVRSGSLIPPALDPFQASVDFNELMSRGLATKLAGLVSAAAFFKDAVRLARRADAICSHWLLPSGLAGVVASRVTRRPHVAIEHSGALHLLGNMRGGHHIARFIARGSDRIITVSEDLRRKLVALCPEAEAKSQVIPMGVAINEDDSYRPRPLRHSAARCDDASRKRSIVFVGRLTKVKGVDLLLRAMSGLDGARLMVAGAGEERDSLERMARALSVDAAFLGKTDAAGRDELLALADVVVIPSRVMDGGRTEGTPVVCLEAMAAGRLVVASRAGGLPEIIVDGQTGLLVGPGDVRGLRDGLVRAMADLELRFRVSANAREAARSYSWARIGARFGDAIRDCLKKDGSILNGQRCETAGD